MVSATTRDNLFNIDHGKALDPNRETEKTGVAQTR
jgi:hypothetical protein